MSKSHIPREKAFEYIDNYKNNSPVGALESVWLDSELIDFIISMKQTPINGLRVYMARYTEDDTQGKYRKDENTVIVVPTIKGIVPERGIDMEDGYFNYGHPCPPECDR